MGPRKESRGTDGAQDAPDRPPGMRVSPSETAEDRGVRRVNDVVRDDFKWIFREQPLPDFGIDAQMELVDDDAIVTGQLIGLQIKSGTAGYFSKPKGSTGWTFSDSNDHLEYWLAYRMPVIVVLIDDDGNAYWQIISPETVRERKKSFAVIVPRNQPFDASARDQLKTIAANSRGALQPLSYYYELLPPDAVLSLQRAGHLDLRATTRLAERLATNRSTPELITALLVAGTPTWLRTSTAAQDLWFAVGAYAAEHGKDHEASSAFALAADIEGPRSPRARVLAGLTLLFIDRSRAGEYLHRARAEGQVLLADIGLSALDVPPGDARVFDIPQSMIEASDSELNAEPSVLNFLAEMALRRKDLNTAVSYRMRAVEHSRGSGSNLKLALAETLMRRSQESDPGRRDLRSALKYAQMAIEDRRRWDGPSAEALSTLLDIQIGFNDASEGLHAALPESEGGTARDVEATHPGVARRGALVAHIAGNLTAKTFFMEHVPEGPHRHELSLIFDTDVNEEASPQKIQKWTDLLNEAADDAMALRCISRLVRFGIWPAQAEDLWARSLLRQEMYETLRAVQKASSGRLDEGLAALRELAARFPLAAFQLVEVLERKLGPADAIDEADRQAAHWRDPLMSLLLVDLLQRYDRDGEAADRIKMVLADDTFPDDVRLSLCRWYVVHQALEDDFTEAVAAARRGLEIAEDPELAWNLIKALRQQGLIIQAFEALDRHRPDPVKPDEMRLWVELHLGRPIASRDAQIMLDLVQRLPRGEIRSTLISLLVREVLLTPAGVAPSYSSHIRDAVGELRDELERWPSPGLSVIDNDADVRKMLEREQVDPNVYQRLVQDVRQGRYPVAEIGKLVGRSYGAALLHRAAGCLVAVDLQPGLRSAGEAAAEAALNARTCVVDLSAIYLLDRLDKADRLLIRSALRDAEITAATVMDCARTREDMRGQALATYTAALREDGTVERTTLTPLQREQLRERSELLESTASSFTLRRPQTHANAVDETLDLAIELKLALWCDDSALRQLARGRGIRTFGIIDLVSVLGRQGIAVDISNVLHRLAADYVVDLPLSADDIIALAIEPEWEPGPAHAAVSRAGWWQHHHNDWKEEWLKIATAARESSPDALTTMTRAVLTGALSQIGGGFETQRYQEIVVLALVACYQANSSAPDRFLALLGELADPTVPPRPGYVVTALDRELQARSLGEPFLTAHDLLPGVEPVT